MKNRNVQAIVLVHGAWHGGWCFGRVADLLRSAGHRVVVPTLTGLGERCHLLSRTVNLATHIEDVVNVIRWEEIDRVVLVGHSYGGFVVTGVADAIADRIAALVYLDAFLPVSDKSFHDIVPTELVASQLQSAQPTHGLSVPPIPAAAFNVNEADRAWVDSMCTAHPLRTLTEPIHLAGRYADVVDNTYVYATENPIPVFAGFAAQARNRSWISHDLPCGHDVMIDMPQATADIIKETASRTDAAHRQTQQIENSLKI